ncbi:MULTISPECIES: hypothetical protein [unclassified Roseibium]|uniref:hypothetical protein n=1 Tax=unclassified Roseibium TaxID=2629323 RepID=UPI00273E66BD|nr:MULTISPECIES: hypothetical protein [unclassified Roseibium]
MAEETVASEDLEARLASLKQETYARLFAHKVGIMSIMIAFKTMHNISDEAMEKIRTGALEGALSQLDQIAESDGGAPEGWDRVIEICKDEIMNVFPSIDSEFDD